MTEAQFVARLKNGGFTRTGTAQEVFEGLQRLLPVDKLYVILESPDGKGYELLEAGDVVVDFAPLSKDLQPGAPQRSQEPLSPPTPTQSRAPVIEAASASPEPFNEPLPTNPETKEGYSFSPDVPAPLTQGQIDKKLGTNQPRPGMTKAAKNGNMTKLSKGKKRHKSKDVSKSAPAVEPSETDQCSDDPNDKTWLEGLPPPVRVSSHGRTSVTSIRTATDAERAAASIDLDARRTY